MTWFNTKSKYVLLSFILIFYISCSNEAQIKHKFSFDELFDETYSFEIPDTLGPKIFVNSLTIVDQKFIYFTELYTAAVYKIDMSNGTMDRVSIFGSGPGEYQNPGTILYENDSLYIGDVNPFINVLNNKGVHIREMKMVGYQNFVKYDGVFYRYSSEPSDYYFYSSTGQKISKRPMFLKNAYPSPATPGVFEHYGTMYFMNNYEAKIFKLDLKNLEQLNHIKLQGFIDQSWDDYYENKIDHQLINSRAEGYHFFWRFDKFFINKKLYFYLRAKNPKTNIVEQFIVNDSGQIEFKIESKKNHKLYFQYSFQNKSVFTLYDEVADKYFIKIYNNLYESTRY